MGMNPLQVQRQHPVLPLLLSLLLLILAIVPAQSFIPPKPGTDLAATYEPVHLYRQKRNITYSYSPKALHPETCRYLSEEECQNADESMQRHHQRHRDIQRKLAHQRRLDERRRLVEQTLQEELQQDSDKTGAVLRGSSANNNDNDNDRQQPDREVVLSEEDELQFHMAEFQKLLARFTEAYTDGNGPTPQDEMEELQQLLRDRNQTLEQAGRALQEENEERQERAAAQGQNPRVGTFNVLVLLLRFSDHTKRNLPNKYEYQILWNLRIRKWLIQNSYGNYDAWFEVRPWKKSTKSEKYSAFGQSGRVAGFQESYWPLLDDLDKSKDWDWSRFDVDENGLLDNLIVLHSGYAAEEGGEDCTNGREYLDRIWSHAFSDSNGWRNEAGTYGVEGYMIASGLDLTCDSIPAKMGVMTHEYLHTFYLIDLYDYSFEGKGVGQFDIMAYPYGFENDGNIPVGLSVWAKTAIDWLTCEEVSSSGTYTLEPAVLGPACLRINLVEGGEEGFDEYLLLENRQQLAFDVNFWKSGLVIYHIDDAANEQYDRGYPGQGGWPGNGKHYQVAVLQADGKYDLEQGENIGDEGDMFIAGMKLTPNNNGKTYPNTDSYQGGKIKKSGVTVEVMEADGRNFPVKITLGGRSGGDDSIEKFSAPVKEDHAEAQAQFHIPDGEGVRISGKIPQLPWREEQDKSTESSAAVSAGCRYCELRILLATMVMLLGGAIML